MTPPFFTKLKNLLVVRPSMDYKKRVKPDKDTTATTMSADKVNIDDEAPAKKQRVPDVPESPPPPPAPPVQQQGEAKSPHVFYPSRYFPDRFIAVIILIRLDAGIRTLIRPRSSLPRSPCGRKRAAANCCTCPTSSRTASNRS
jgi:hypothetical protein